MSDLIRRYELLSKAINERKFVIQFEDLLNNQLVIQTVYKDLADFLNSVPTVDAVEVVRCGDCKRWDCEEQECRVWYGFHENDFCSYGERKDE